MSWIKKFDNQFLKEDEIESILQSCKFFSDDFSKSVKDKFFNDK